MKREKCSHINSIRLERMSEGMNAYAWCMIHGNMLLLMTTIIFTFLRAHCINGFLFHNIQKLK